MRGRPDRATIAENTSRGILILVVLFVLLIGVIIAFSRVFITAATGAEPAVASIALAVAVALPVVFLAITVYQLVKRLRRPMQGLRLRLTIFFILISVLSAGPQALLAVTFINSAMGTWFRSSIGTALRGASTIAFDYQQEKQQALLSFLNAPHVTARMSQFAAAPEPAWRSIRELNTVIDSLQAFSEDGKEVAFRGDPRARLPDFASALVANGRDDRPDVTILRAVRTLTVDARRLTVVVSVVLPASLRLNARQITESLTLFAALDRFRTLFQVVLVGFFFLFSLPIFFITIQVSLLLTERILSPIVHLEEATLRVASGDFSTRILTRPRDELAHLVDSFNSMVSELDRSRRKLLQAERITAWQEIAQRLAHEIRNPLTPIKLSAQRILKKHEQNAVDLAEVLPPAVSSIIQEVENLERLLREFGEFAKLPVPKPSRVNLREMLTEVASVYASLSSTVRISMDEVPPETVLHVDRNQMKRVFANLFTNAIQAMPKGGELAVRADLVRKARDSYFRIAVSDTGIGIPEENRDSIFDPYFTTKPDGTGLGLAIVQRIVFDHKGNVWAESNGGSGTTFFIDLPAPDAGGPAA
ncbi:MAG TPA: ATP-binding protein [Spirochaetia bacterium]|nr:ATP-binding protein [Spirochaetia bacterium]